MPEQNEDHSYKIIELVGSSSVSIEEAAQNAISKASQTLRGLRWFQIVETRGYIEDGKVIHYQVILKVGFTLQ
jgi:flavin-binding protein dodecin